MRAAMFQTSIGVVDMTTSPELSPELSPEIKEETPSVFPSPPSLSALSALSDRPRRAAFPQPAASTGV